MKLEKGQKVWIGFRNEGVKKFVIDRVGRKYFYVFLSNHAAQFDIETLQRVTEYTHNSAQVYLSLEDYENANRAQVLRSQIDTFFRSYSWKLSLEQMEKIAETLNFCR